MVRARFVLPLLLLWATAWGDRATDRLDARIRRQAAGRTTGQSIVGRRENLTRVGYAAGDLLHMHPQGTKDNPRGPVERAVYLTARHLGLPLRVAPPVVPHEATVYGPGYLMPWIPRLRNIMDGDATLSYELPRAGWHEPQRIDWESVHAVVVLDFVTGQSDRGWHNTFIRERGGKLGAVALDNELAFGWRSGETISTSGSPLGLLVRNAPTWARTLSPRIRRGLDAIDVAAWKKDLAEQGIAPAEIEAAAGRLEKVKRDGFVAIFPEAVLWK